MKQFCECIRPKTRQAFELSTEIVSTEFLIELLPKKLESLYFVIKLKIMASTLTRYFNKNGLGSPSSVH